MRVIYDISVLGMGFYAPRARTGIFRVIENLAVELERAGVISAFSSGAKPSDYFKCFDYLQSVEYFRTIELAIPELNGVTLNILRYFHDSHRDKNEVLFGINTIGRVINGIVSRTFARNVMNMRMLKTADIFHSPFFPLPKNIKHLKKVITIYDLIPVLYPQFFEGNVRENFQEVLSSIDENTWVTCISHATKKDLCAYLPELDPTKVFVTHLAASSMFFPCLDRLKIVNAKLKFGIPNGPYILSLSTLEPRKNISHTIKCFARLLEDEAIDDLSLVLVGTKGWDFDPIFDAIAASPKIRERIVVTGYVADEDLAPLYSGAMMFVYPSFYEGFGLPPLEAMQCGVPVVTSNTSSLPEVVGEAGIMVDPSDEEALCQAMRTVYESSDLRHQMAQASLSQANKFSWEKCANQTIEAYKAALAS